MLADTDFSLFGRKGSTLILSLPLSPVASTGDRANSSLFPNASRKLFVTRKTKLYGDEGSKSLKTEDDTSNLKKLYALIERAESRKDGYNSVHHKAKIRPHKPPTELTLREIFTWIEQTPGQPHAIGRYQFIPKTLKALVDQKQLPLDRQFSPAVQDQLAQILVEDAGYEGFVLGHLHTHQFMNNLAKIWAGFPTKNGRSFYHGYAGNKASISWNEFEQFINQLKI